MSENKQEVRTQTVVPKDFTCSSGRTQEDSFVAEAAAAYNIGQKDGEYTLKDYYALPDDIRAELIDGHLIYMDAPTTRHQGVIAELYFQISSYIRARKGPCKALFSPLDVREYWIIDPKKQTVSTNYFDEDGDVNVTHYTFGEKVPVRT